MIKAIGKKDLREAVDLVNKVFDEFVATDYSEEGKKTFYEYVQHKYEELLGQLDSGEKQFWGYFVEGRPAGVIAVRMTENEASGIPLHPHIALLFVSKEYHRQGIARKLFEAVKEEFLGHEGDHTDGPFSMMSVNSSLYAVDVYRRFGFSETGPEQEMNGIRFVPMWLLLKDNK